MLRLSDTLKAAVAVLLALGVFRLIGALIRAGFIVGVAALAFHAIPAGSAPGLASLAVVAVVLWLIFGGGNAHEHRRRDR